MAASDGSLAALLDDVFARHKLEGAVVTRTSNTILDAVCTGRPRFVTSHSSTQAQRACVAPWHANHAGSCHKPSDERLGTACEREA